MEAYQLALRILHEPLTQELLDEFNRTQSRVLYLKIVKSKLVLVHVYEYDRCGKCKQSTHTLWTEERYCEGCTDEVVPRGAVLFSEKTRGFFTISVYDKYHGFGLMRTSKFEHFCVLRGMLPEELAYQITTY